jgi:prolyl oligopeptidase
MRQLTLRAIIMTSLSASCLLSAVSADATPPTTRKSDVIETLHGVQIPDPYRWLEDDNAPETLEWVKAQNAHTRAYLDALPARAALRSEIEAVWNYAKMSAPTRRAGVELYSYNDGLQNQAVLYWRPVGAPHSEARVALDPNVASEEGVWALKSAKLSPEGRFMAYQYAKAGSDWAEIKVRDLMTGQDLTDHLEWVKFSGLSWAKDGSGFYYSRYDAPKEGEALTGVNYYQKLYFHTLHSPQTEDTLIYARSDQKEWGFDGHVSEDGRLLIISVWQGASEKNQVFYKRLDRPHSPVTPLVDNFEASFSFLGNEGDTLWFKTDLNAPKGRVVSINLSSADPAAFKTLIPEAEEAMEFAQAVGGRFVVGYLRHAASTLKVFTLDGRFERELPLPGIGSASALKGHMNSAEATFTFTGFTSPGAVYTYTFESGEVTPLFKPTLDVDLSTLTTRQIFATSKDGTKVPAFVVHSKDLDLTKPHPTLLYAYGGFNISLTPYFKPDLLPWLKRGGVYVVANLRGGGEYGEAWHKAGMKGNKQNVFDDFIAVAEHLIAEGVTSAPQLAIHGGSNGGLLVGAVLNQRPELFGAAVPAVGVMDMLRFHKFTIGWAWVPEYGSPDNPDDFKVLKAYSPLHTLKRGASYPPVMVMTADHDDRVVPAHSFKYTAALQAAQGGKAPILIRIDSKAGHGAGTPTAKLIDSKADLWAFLAESLGL